ncbi:MAG: hypothetical protein KKF39_02720, partial [Nanoarchaeota archaeon]|nr:hypothetical protein [Nanoarchaeota archaeon]
MRKEVVGIVLIVVFVLVFSGAEYFLLENDLELSPGRRGAPPITSSDSDIREVQDNLLSEYSIDFNSEEINSLPLEIKEGLKSLSPERQTELNYELKEIRKEVQDKGGLWEADFTSKYLLSDEERESLYGLKPPTTPIEEQVGSGERSEMLPDFFDWREQHGEDYITSIKDQAACGSCWAFGALASLEGSTNAYYNNPDLDIDMSEQDLVSCYLGDGCNGAYTYEIEELFSDYLQNNGVSAEECFPYTATDSDCSNRCADWQQTAWKIVSYANPTLSVDAIKQTIMEYGPVNVGMEIYEDFLVYSEGIYFHVTGRREGDHSVTIVGWGMYDGMEYWIVKNSWGTGWGEDGYFKILMGDSGIDSWFAYAVEEPQPLLSDPPEKLCNDNDGDGYCNWGIGVKPDNCPPCDGVIGDCDDANESIFENCGLLMYPIGYLNVTSEPSGAGVYVKDEITQEFVYRGETPRVIGLKTGEREIKLTRKFYSDEIITEEVIEDQVIDVHVLLTLRPPIEICTPEDLDNVRSNLDYHYIQVCDIDLSEWGEFEPIRSVDIGPVHFSGLYDGQGHKISNLFQSSSYWYSGLFGLIKNGEVKNLKLENITLEAQYVNFRGGLVGEAMYANISGVSVSGFIEGGGVITVGGLVGYSYRSTIEKSAADIVIEGHAGGLVGDMCDGIIRSSYSVGEVNTQWPGIFLGGLVESFGDLCRTCGCDSKIENSHSDVRLSTGEHVGGLVGGLVAGTGTINNSYSVGITNGNILGRGLIGQNKSMQGYELEIISSYWDINSSGTDWSAGGEGRTTEEMTSVPRPENTYVGWDFENVWLQSDGDYPMLAWEEFRICGNGKRETGEECDDGNVLDRDGCSSSCDYEDIEICTAEDLDNVRNNLDYHYVQVCDIDLSGWGEFEPIAMDSRFKGSYNGNGFKISNVSFNGYRERVGFFGNVFRGIISNVWLENINFSNGVYELGGLVGLSHGGTIKNTKMRNINLVGGDETGGLVGRSFWTFISQVSVDGAIDGGDTVGGLVGVGEGVMVLNSYANVEVSSSYGGGLVGELNPGDIINSYSTGDVGSGGGLIIEAGYSDTEVVSSYWDINSSGTDWSDGGEGRTTEEMTSVPRPADTYVDWDFENVWCQEDGQYPVFECDVLVPCEPQHQCRSDGCGQDPIPEGDVWCEQEYGSDYQCCVRTMPLTCSELGGVCMLPDDCNVILASGDECADEGYP